jgi:hypothetical protein
VACGIESVLIVDRQQLPMIAISIRTPGLTLYDCRIDPTEAMAPSVSHAESLDSLISSAEAGPGNGSDGTNGFAE